MNSDQVKGKIEHAVGHVKEAFGEAVGNNKVANEGLADQVKGATRETWGNVKDASGTAAEQDRVASETTATDHATNARQSVSESIDRAKNAINDHIDAYKETHNR